MHLLSDEELVVKAQQNDATAIEELLKRYKYVVSAVAHSYFLTSGDKEDLLQEGSSDGSASYACAAAH